MNIILGKEYEDKITGFSGIATGKAQYLTGCDQVCLKPKVDKDGKMQDAQWFDDGEIKLIGKGITAKEVKGSSNGGPQPDAPLR